MAVTAVSERHSNNTDIFPERIKVDTSHEWKRKPIAHRGISIRISRAIRQF